MTIEIKLENGTDDEILDDKVVIYIEYKQADPIGIRVSREEAIEVREAIKSSQEIEEHFIIISKDKDGNARPIIKISEDIRVIRFIYPETKD